MEGFRYEILISSNLEKGLSMSNYVSYKYRLMGISMNVDLENMFLQGFRSKIKLRKIKESKIIKTTPVFKKKEIVLFDKKKIFYLQDKSFVSFPFKIGRKLFIIKNIIKMSEKPKKINFLLSYDGRTGFWESGKTEFDYISSYNDNIVGVKTRKFPEYYILNENFKIIKTLRHKGLIIPKDIIKKGNRVYIHKKRYKRGESAVEIMENGKTKYYFNRVQSVRDELEEVAVADDTVFSVGENSFYISFIYPKDNFIRLYKYEDRGKVFEIKINIEDEYFGMAKEWKNIMKLIRKGVYDIASVNGIFEGRKYLYIATGRNSIKKTRGRMIDERLSDYLYILSRDSKDYYGRIKLRYGTPIYYDRESGYFYSVKLKNYPEKEIWRWKILVR
jgi:hypothetical protein